MKTQKIISICLLLASYLPVMAGDAYLFAYFTNRNGNRNGLLFAYSEDGYK